MSIVFRIPELLFDSIKRDLARPHAFAAERVGFLYARVSDLDSDHPQILGYDYELVKDDQYIRDRTVGARIDATSIRGVRQRVLSRQEAAFHVHAHIGYGIPRLSRTDIAQLPPVVESFRTTCPQVPHGLVLLSDDSVGSFVWMPGKTAYVAAEVVIVGLPMQFFEGAGNE